MYPRNVKPLIILGRQRAGTRFLTEVLNSFDEVAIQGEIPNPVMRSAKRLIQDIDRFYAEMAKGGDVKGRREYKGWLRKKEDLVLSIWEHAGQSRRVKYHAKTKYFGYKRPNNESYFTFYERTFKYRPATYVYCTRNFIDNYLSIASRWPERDIERVSSEYMQSTMQYHKMTERAPGRVLLFNLDDHVRRGPAYIEENILMPLGLKLTKDHKQELERMSATNRTEEDLNIPRRRELTKAEQDFIRAHPELESEFRKLCASCGVI
jgi:hypothetical protein